MVGKKHVIAYAVLLSLMKLRSVFGHSGSCFEKYPDYDISSGTSPGLIAYGNTGGDFITCEKKCRDDWKCYAFTQYFEGEFPNSGLCYGREYGQDILVAVDTAYVVVSGVKIPCRYVSWIELFDNTVLETSNTDQHIVLNDSTNILSSSDISSLRVYGPAQWMVFTGENFSGRRLVVTEGFWKTSSLGHIGNDAIRSIKKIDLCSERPIGIQNLYIIPNSAFTQWQALEERTYPFRARLNGGLIDDIYGHGALEAGKHISGGWTHYQSATNDFGIQLDLGRLYRISSIVTQGTCYCDGTQLISPAYHLSEFELSYAVDGIDFHYYSLDGNVVTFLGNSQTNYNIDKTNVFDPSFIASSVRIVTKTGNYLGLRFELYGCAVDVPDNKPMLINTDHQNNDINTNELVDGNPNTCISLEILGRNVLKIPTGQFTKTTLTLTASYSLPDAGCTSYSDVLFLVHTTPPLNRDTQGIFTKCDVIEQEITTKSAVLTYQCTCPYGFCENVVIRTRIELSCGLLCDVENG